MTIFSYVKAPSLNIPAQSILCPNPSNYATNYHPLTRYATLIFPYCSLNVAVLYTSNRV